MTAKTVAERQRTLRQARTAAGLVRLELWAHPADHAALKAEAAKMARRRAKPAQATRVPPAR
ncbi:MAG: hypothetical protein NUV51_08340 [Sulfuricaulis sp.]|nr:hypothetical protein [Sulfuricaulis sp.]